MNVLPERYCPRLTSNWGVAKPPEDRCVECSELVVYNPTVGEGSVRLVCLDCLHTGIRQ